MNILQMQPATFEKFVQESRRFCSAMIDSMLLLQKPSFGRLLLLHESRSKSHHKVIWIDLRITMEAEKMWRTFPLLAYLDLTSTWCPPYIISPSQNPHHISTSSTIQFYSCLYFITFLLPLMDLYDSWVPFCWHYPEAKMLRRFELHTSRTPTQNPHYSAHVPGSGNKPLMVCKNTNSFHRSNDSQEKS